MQYVATCCSVLQSVAVCHSVSFYSHSTRSRQTVALVFLAPPHDFIKVSHLNPMIRESANLRQAHGIKHVFRLGTIDPIRHHPNSDKHGVRAYQPMIKLQIFWKLFCNQPAHDLHAVDRRNEGGICLRLFCHLDSVQ